MNMQQVEYIQEKIKKLNARTQRRRAELEDALDILGNAVNSPYFKDITNRAELEKAMLNGADNWHHYSWAGCHHCYNYSIAKHYLTPSEQKRCNYGEWRLNGYEMLDIQAISLRHASSLVKSLFDRAQTDIKS